MISTEMSVGILGRKKANIIDQCQNRKVLELESVRIGKCQNCKWSELFGSLIRIL